MPTGSGIDLDHASKVFDDFMEDFRAYMQTDAGKAAAHKYFAPSAFDRRVKRFARKPAFLTVMQTIRERVYRDGHTSDKPLHLHRSIPGVSMKFMELFYRTLFLNYAEEEFPDEVEFNDLYFVQYFGQGECAVHAFLNPLNPSAWLVNNTTPKEKSTKVVSKTSWLKVTVTRKKK